MGGKTPYGFRTEPHVIQGIKNKRLVVEPTEAAFVKLMYEMYIDPRVSLHNITRTLTAKDVAFEFKDGTIIHIDVRGK